MVRFAEVPDLPVICEIRRQVHAVHVDGRPDIFKMPEQPEEVDRQLYEGFSNDDHLLFVCAAHRTIVGYALVRLVAAKDLCMMQARYDYFIGEFGVEKSMRRQGFGRELMNAVITHAEEHHATSVSLDVWGFNENAERFYRNLGMKTKRTFLELPLTTM